MAAPSPRPEGLFSPFRAAAAPLLTLWLLPALAIAALTALPSPATAPLPGGPDVTPEEAVQVLASLFVVLYAQLFLIVLVNAPAAAVVQGRSVREAMRVLAQGAVVRVALFMALLLSLALLLTMLPGVLATYLNPLMGLIFLVVGTIGGGAAAVGLFARWMYAPALAALEGRSAAEALDASRARAKAERNFGTATGLAVGFVLTALLAAGLGALAASRAPIFPVAARALATLPLLWLGLAAISGAVAGRASLPVRHAGEQGLAMRARATQCPRCGAVAQAAQGAQGSPVRCPSCGLAAVLR